MDSAQGAPSLWPYADCDPQFTTNNNQVQGCVSLKELKFKKNGGEGGIRTPDGLAPMPHFECGAFNHSATSPRGWSAL